MVLRNRMCLVLFETLVGVGIRIVALVGVRLWKQYVEGDGEYGTQQVELQCEAHRMRELELYSCIERSVRHLTLCVYTNKAEPGKEKPRMRSAIVYTRYEKERGKGERNGQCRIKSGVKGAE
jgi:hypothetical protein